MSWLTQCGHVQTWPRVARMVASEWHAIVVINNGCCPGDEGEALRVGEASYVT
jgi:hypothetical protein